MINRGWAVVATAIVGLTLLAGCSESEPSTGAGQVHTPTAWPSGSPSSTASPPATSATEAAYAQVPKAARAHTYAGAQAFAEFYIAQSTGLGRTRP